MLARCPYCDVAHRVDPTRLRPVRCRCGQTFLPDVEPVVRPPLPLAARLAGIAGIAWFAVGPPWVGIGVGLIVDASDLAAVPRGPLVAALVFFVAGLALVGGIGVLVRRPWGWWTLAAAATVGAVDQAKFLVPLLAALDWEHPRAGMIAGAACLVHGLPLLLFAALGLLLARRSVREACGVSSAPRRR